MELHEKREIPEEELTAYARNRTRNDNEEAIKQIHQTEEASWEASFQWMGVRPILPHTVRLKRGSKTRNVKIRQNEERWNSRLSGHRTTDDLCRTVCWTTTYLDGSTSEVKRQTRNTRKRYTKTTRTKTKKEAKFLSHGRGTYRQRSARMGWRRRRKCWFREFSWGPFSHLRENWKYRRLWFCGY